MATLHAPFNFVPLPKQVFFPDWADQVSQDIPFADGESGVIELEITAQTPIFIRDGEKMKDKDGNILKDKDGKEIKNPTFCHTKDGTYFIPATSLKGMFRSVIEILSYGKLDKHTFQNQSFGIRSLTGKDGENYRYLIKPEFSHCGWLSKKGDDYFLDDCGFPGRISCKDIDTHFSSQLNMFIEDVKKQGLFQKDENKTAKRKYAEFERTSGKTRDELICNYSIDEEQCEKVRKFDKRLFVRFNPKGQKGIIVLTGQPGKVDFHRKNPGKHYEFVFPCNIENKGIIVPKDIIEAFESVHKESLDYSDFRKQELENGEHIPVFFTYDEDNQIEAIGLTYMFKFPAYNKTHDAARNTNRKYLSDDMDLSDCIFGTLNGSPLKGRVMFSHAFATNIPTVLDERRRVLSSPHPSYYPLYVANDETWDTENTEIKGRKRYPIRNNEYKGTEGTNNMGTVMQPLDKGTVFTSKIRYHNLRPIEIGALLSAILFHNHGNCLHSLGSGKPLGYGGVKVRITNLDGKVIKHYLDIFEEQMKIVDSEWGKSVTLRELYAMAEGIPAKRDSEFEYMFQDKDTSIFEEGKKTHGQGERFGLFTEIISNKVKQGGNIVIRDPKLSHKHNNTQFNEIREKREADERKLEEIKKHINAQNFLQAKEQWQKLNFTDTKDAKDLLVSIEMGIKQLENQQILANAQKENEERNKAIVEGGLKGLLDEKFLDRDEYKVKAFKVCSDKIKKWMKEAQITSLPNEQFEALHSCLIRLRQNPCKNEVKDWNNKNSFIWKRIEELVGKELMIQWFNE